MEEGQQLVNSTSDEKLLEKVGSLKKFKSGIGISERELKSRKEIFVYRFVAACWDQLGISRDDLKNKFSNQELLRIGDLLAKKMGEGRTKQKIILLLIPIVGWSMLCEMSEDYYNLHRFLRNIYGDDYFPYPEFRKELGDPDGK